MPVPYVDYGGSQIHQPPYVAENVNFYGFTVPADPGALQKLLDDRLNLPSGGSEDFVPAGPFVTFAFTTIDKLYSQNPPDFDKGASSEQEFAIWISVVDRKRNQNASFQPYMFVDNSYAMAAGREVYGFPKAIGWLDIPSRPALAATFSIDTLILRQFLPGALISRATLVAAATIGPWHGELKIARTLLEFERELRHQFEEPKEVINALKRTALLQAPLVFLKQFPAGDVPGTACYQAIAECQSTITVFHGGSPLGGLWQIDITAADSHPIAQDLGLLGNSVYPTSQYWVNYDMTIGLATNLWVATGV